MRQVFKLKTAVRWSKKSGFTDQFLLRALDEIEQGLFDADYGAGLYKKRVAKPGKGKSGGWRIIIAKKEIVNEGQNTYVRWLFATGYSKNEMDDLPDDKRDFYKAYCSMILSKDTQMLKKLVLEGDLIKVTEQGTKDE